MIKIQVNIFGVKMEKNGNMYYTPAEWINLGTWTWTRAWATLYAQLNDALDALWCGLSITHCGGQVAVSKKYIRIASLIHDRFLGTFISHGKYFVYICKEGILIVDK